MTGDRLRRKEPSGNGRLWSAGSREAEAERRDVTGTILRGFGQNSGMLYMETGRKKRYRRMTKKQTAWTAAGCVVVGVCVLCAVFAPRLRSAWGLVRGMTMDEETRAANEEQNRQIETELQERYAVPDAVPDEETAAGVLDGTLSLEEAANRLLEQSGGLDIGALTGQDGTTDTNGTSGGGTTDSASGGDTANDGETSGGTQSPANEIQTPANEAQTPANETQTPANETQTPANETQTPANETQTPSNETQTPANETQTPANETQTPAEPTAEEKAAAEKEKRLQNLVTQAQVLRSVFLGRLDSVVAECKQEFLSLDPSEQTTRAKVRIVTARLGEVADMEEECDAQVASIVSQIRELDSDLADKVQQQYESEKLAKKSSLLKEYRSGG